MPDPTYPITGIRSGWGDPVQNAWGPRQPVPVRVEVDDFFRKEEYAMQLDLLYHAMVEFQKISYVDKLSYFQVAGIHGLPHIPWDAPGCYAPQYCEHSTPKFGSWHRPYMLLFEQRLYEIMTKTVIPRYPAQFQQAMTDAADKFRMPYWDWALKKSRLNNGAKVTVYDLPLIVKPKTVKVSDPKSVDNTGTQTIPNPFYKFQAQDVMGEFGVVAVQMSEDGEPYEGVSFDRTFSTSRLPVPKRNAQGIIVPPDAFFTTEGIAGLEGAQQQLEEAVWYLWDRPGPPGTDFKLAEATYRLLSSSYFDSFPEFVTALRDESKPEPDGKYYLSLETIHNNIHNWTGQGYGHMAYIPVAAFDPIFWLHHCNVDRLMAIWQEINPDKWFDGSYSELAKQPLTPFHTDTEGSFYNANNCKDFFSLGYTYPELQPWKYTSQEAYETSIKASNSRKYRPPAPTLLTLSNKDVIINVSFEKFALSGVPFTVKVFLGERFVGEVHNFSTYVQGMKTGTGTGCQNCEKQKAAKTVVTGQVFLSEELAEAVRDLPGIKALTEEEIKAYVKANLKAKVYTNMGKEVTIPSLKVVPFIGQREIFKVPVPGVSEGVAKLAATSEHAVDGHVLSHQGETALPGGIVDLDEIAVEDLPYIHADWDKEGKVVLVYGAGDKKSSTPIAAIRAGGWGAYEAF